MPDIGRKINPVDKNLFNVNKTAAEQHCWAFVCPIFINFEENFAHKEHYSSARSLFKVRNRGKVTANNIGCFKHHANPIDMMNWVCFSLASKPL